MREKGGFFQRSKSLVWLGGILVMVGMALYFEEKVVGKAVRCIPTVEDGDFFILTVWKNVPL